MDTTEPRRTRPDWDQYYIEMAYSVATRSSCNRGAAGAILVKDNVILSTGYNGSIRGLPSCFEAGCLVVDDHCVRTIHAEMNALVHAAKHGASIDGATLYTTYTPCWGCFRVLANGGVKRYVWQEDYNTDRRVLETAEILGLELLKLEEL